MYQVLTYEPTGECLGTVVLLPGRDGRADDMLRYYQQYSTLDHTRFVSVEPFDEWYPAPNGPNDQQAAIWGLKVSVPELDNFISEIEKEYSITRSKIALVGYSAGAVMAIQLVAESDRSFAAIIAHAGAILDPDSLPKCKNNTPVYLIHSKNDDCFDWNERYLPMKEALLKQEYAVLETIENETGGHGVSQEDIIAASNFLKKEFLYPSS